MNAPQYKAMIMKNDHPENVGNRIYRKFQFLWYSSQALKQRFYWARVRKPPVATSRPRHLTLSSALLSFWAELKTELAMGVGYTLQLKINDKFEE